MYGWIDACLESLVLKNHGPDIWAQILELSECSVASGDFLRNVHYPDDQTYRLATAASTILNISAETILEMFGAHFVHYLEEYGYGSTLQCQGSTFVDWIRNVNEPHRLLRARFPLSRFPEFFCEADDQNTTGDSLILHYYSHRNGLLAAVAVGIVKEAAKYYFNTILSMTMNFSEYIEATNTFHATWRIVQMPGPTNDGNGQASEQQSVLTASSISHATTSHAGGSEHTNSITSGMKRPHMSDDGSDTGSGDSSRKPETKTMAVLADPPPAQEGVESALAAAAVPSHDNSAAPVRAAVACPFHRKYTSSTTSLINLNTMYIDIRNNNPNNNTNNNNNNSNSANNMMPPSLIPVLPPTPTQYHVVPPLLSPSPQLQLQSQSSSSTSSLLPSLAVPPPPPASRMDAILAAATMDNSPSIPTGGFTTTMNSSIAPEKEVSTSNKKGGNGSGRGSGSGVALEGSVVGGQPPQLQQPQQQQPFLSTGTNRSFYNPHAPLARHASYNSATIAATGSPSSNHNNQNNNHNNNNYTSAAATNTNMTTATDTTVADQFYNPPSMSMPMSSPYGIHSSLHNHHHHNNLTIDHNNNNHTTQNNTTNHHHHHSNKPAAVHTTNHVGNSLIGIDGIALKTIFPFHVIINNNLQIMQVGDRLATILSDDLLADTNFMGNYFQISSPPNFPWYWRELKKLKNNSIELTLFLPNNNNNQMTAEDDAAAVQPPSTGGSGGDRGEEGEGGMKMRRSSLSGRGNVSGLQNDGLNSYSYHGNSNQSMSHSYSQDQQQSTTGNSSSFFSPRTGLGATDNTPSSSSSMIPIHRILFRGEIIFLNDGNHHYHSNNNNSNNNNSPVFPTSPAAAAAAAGPLALFLISPELKNIDELFRLGMDINDLPKHSFQRDVLMYGDHLKFETSDTVKLSQLSKQLDRESRKAQKALKTKRVFVRYVSHEIRTPLNITLLGLKYLEDELHKTIINTTNHLANKAASTTSADSNYSSNNNNGTSSTISNVNGLDENINAVLDDVKHSCAVAVDILNDLLLYEKLDDGIFSLSKSPVPMRDFIEEALRVFKVQARSSDLNFAIEVVGIDHVVVDIDRTKLHQVLRNLLSNALKFTPHKGTVTLSCKQLTRMDIETDHSIIFGEKIGSGNSVLAAAYAAGVERTESLSSDALSASERAVHYQLHHQGQGLQQGQQQQGQGQQGQQHVQHHHYHSHSHSHHHHHSNSTPPRPVIQYVRIAVQDTGHGISSQDQKSLFHEFAQVKADQLQNGQGSGLGLWIAATIMKLHEGRIGVKSEGEGRGSTFLIDIPIASFDAYVNTISAEDQMESPRIIERTLSGLTKKKLSKDCRILIVDDSVTNRKMVRRLLQSRFQSIEEAENGQDAIDLYNLSMLSGQPFHVIMMDNSMPVMNGVEATRRIKAINPSVIIIGVTGNGVESDVAEFQASGADNVMIKPLNLTDFMSYLDHQHSITF